MTTQSISESAKFPIADARSVWHEVRRALHGQGTRLITVVATMVVGAALGLVPPWALGRMVDAVIDGNGTGRIWLLGVAMIGAALVFAGFTALGVILSSRLFETILARLRERMFTTSLSLPLERVEAAGSGDLVSRATDDVEEVSRAISTVVPALSTSLFTVLLTAVGLTALDWRFLAVLVVALPIYVFAVRWYLRKRRRSTRPSGRRWGFEHSRFWAGCGGSALCTRTTCRRDWQTASDPTRGKSCAGRCVHASCRTGSTDGSIPASSSSWQACSSPDTSWWVPMH